MPSHTAASALIALYAIDGAPWKWPRWQEITGVRHGLFPENDSLLPRGLTRQDADDIASYFKQYSEISGEDQKIKFASGRGGSAVPGRTRWNAYIRQSWEAWKVHDFVVTGLREEDVHPFQITARESADDGSCSWPNADTYIPVAIDTIADAVFGQEAFGDSSRLPAKLRKPLTAMIQRSWARLRMKSKSDEKKLGALEQQARTAFQSLDRDQLTKANLIKTIRTISRWQTHLSPYVNDSDERLKTAADMLSDLEALMENICSIAQKSEVKNKREINSANAKVFREMATSMDIAELQGVYQEYFLHDEADADQPGLESAGQTSISLSDITTGDLGMDMEGSLTPHELSVQLGFKNQRLPVEFNTFRYAAGSATLWSSPASFNADTSNEKTLVPLALHWHQLAGLHSIIRSIFTAAPVTEGHSTGMLISDEVGLGKTGLAISVIAFLNQAISVRDRREPLPPILTKRAFLCGKYKLDRLPHLIVVPGTLTSQWVKELETFFRPKIVDILIYQSSKKGNAEFWSESGAVESSKQEPHHKIIVTTHSSLQHDIKLVRKAKPSKGARPWEAPALKRPGPDALKGTIFGQRYLTVIVDEAHQFRNVGTKQWAALELLDLAEVKILLTGTPLHTAPKDISALGRLIGIPHFRSEAAVQEEKDDNAAFRRAKKLDDDGIALRQAQIEGVLRMQTQFAGHILRRTVDSRNWKGQTLLDLPPHVDILGILKLTEREKGIINARAEDARASVVSGNESGKFQTKKFYHEYRSAVCYAKEDGDAPNPVFQTLEEWDPVKSTKMDVCAKICKHYLSGDDVLDVEFVDGEPVFPTMEASSGPVTQERKIIIYAEFPSMTPLLQNVLKLYGIESLAINGAIPFKQRDALVEQFVHKPGSPRILIFSSIGSAGLNLPIADVVIFFDQPWSAQDERQIRGRAHRQPQKKTVKAIHLLASGSSDLLMKEMALRKQEMFEAFMSKELGQELKDLMSGKTVYRPEDLTDESNDLKKVDAPTAQVKRPKRSKEKKAQDPEPQRQGAEVTPQQGGSQEEQRQGAEVTPQQEGSQEEQQQQQQLQETLPEPEDSMQEDLQATSASGFSPPEPECDVGSSISNGADMDITPPRDATPPMPSNCRGIERSSPTSPCPKRIRFTGSDKAVDNPFSDLELGPQSNQSLHAARMFLGTESALLKRLQPEVSQARPSTSTSEPTNRPQQLASQRALKPAVPPHRLPTRLANEEVKTPKRGALLKPARVHGKARGGKQA